MKLTRIDNKTVAMQIAEDTEWENLYWPEEYSMDMRADTEFLPSMIRLTCKMFKEADEEAMAIL